MSSTQPLRGIRVVSLALNLPGPAALMRLAQMGASCTKINPPAGDPMQHYTPDGYALMHKGVKHHTLDLKTAAGQAAIHKLLPKTDVLLTSFRPEALYAAQAAAPALPRGLLLDSLWDGVHTFIRIPAGLRLGGTHAKTTSRDHHHLRTNIAVPKLS